MHAGDALWWLYGSISVVERLYPTNAQVSHLVSEMRRCAGVIGAHISVPEPSAVDLGKVIEKVRDDLPGEPAPAETPSQQQQSGRSNFSDPEIIEAAKKFVGEMVASELFGWAGMVEDIYQRLNADASPFFTFKQARAIINIALRGESDDGSSFMDQMENEHSEATRAVKDWAEQA